jgi:hypothetical protein
VQKQQDKTAALVQEMEKMSAALAHLQLLLEAKPGIDLTALVQQQQRIMLQMTADMKILKNLNQVNLIEILEDLRFLRIE